MFSVKKLPVLLLAFGAAAGSASYVSFDEISAALDSAYSSVEGAVNGTECEHSGEAISGAWPGGPNGTTVYEGWERQTMACEDLENGRYADFYGENDLYEGPDVVQPVLLTIQVTAPEWDVDVSVDFGYDALLEVSEYIEDANCTVVADGSQCSECSVCEAAAEGSSGATQLGLKADCSDVAGPTADAFANGSCVGVTKLASA